MVALSLCALVLAIGAPGLGWVLAVCVMLASSILDRRIGTLSMLLALALNCLNGFLFGPLAGFRLQPGMPALAILLLLVLPFGASGWALWRRARLK
jgi:hypothetical protein